MNKIFNLFIFAAGAAIGSAVTWKLVKTKYERIADEEIKSVKEVFSKRAESKEEKPNPNEKPDLQTYSKILKDLNYSENTDSKKEEKGDPCERDIPYIITPEEFGCMDGYDAVSLNYYSDGVLTDDWDEIIDNVDEIVGSESLRHFGEYEDDCVFVRNDKTKCDYEVVHDLRKFSDVVNDDDD